MHEAIDRLERAFPTEVPGPAYTVTHRALASAVKVIARADDSSGIVGDACRRLLALHPKAAAAAKVRPSRLVHWMLTFPAKPTADVRASSRSWTARDAIDALNTQLAANGANP